MPYRSPSTSPALSLDDAIEIVKRRELLGEAVHAIAASFRVNPARISEVLNGKRHPEARHVALGSGSRQVV